MLLVSCCKSYSQKDEFDGLLQIVSSERRVLKQWQFPRNDLCGQIGLCSWLAVFRTQLSWGACGGHCRFSFSVIFFYDRFIVDRMGYIF